MKKEFKNSQGITLIALVITIILLLILAGVAIAMLAGDNGILKQAADAKTKTNQASIEEQIKLAVMASIDTDGNVDTEVLTKEINKIDKGNREKIELPCTVEIDGIEQVIESNGEVHKTTIADLKKLQKPVAKKTIITFGEEQITIPEGFKVAEDSAEDIKDGIVVVAPDESEFVWVPVKSASTMYETKTVTQVDGTSKQIKVGKLYNNGDINSPKTWTENSGYREPAILKDTTNGDAVPESTSKAKGIGLLKSIVKLSGTTDNEILGKWEKQLQDEFDEMIKSIEENKGFYVARYECSLTDDKTKIQSIKGKTSATASSSSCNTWYGLYQKNKEYSEKNNLENIVGSSMIWGSQYDRMLIWMKANGKDVTTSIGDNRNKGTGRAVGTTGIVETDKINNIYDLYGNSYEWTLEAYDMNFRVYRRR
ncbi:MAG: hypothetical protein HFJ17_02905 [Clostridia bacterium]|nr:hypothetical protein [Clostridia bacterium]